jgi:TRAP-type C4-dicarboxylate transport system permease small subunit
LENARKILDGIMKFVCVFLFVFMVVIGTYQIVTRYVFNSPSTISEELLTYSFTWLSLLSASYVFGKGEHMKMVFLTDKFGEKVREGLAVVSEVIVICFSALVLVFGGISITKLTLMQKSASLQIPMGYIYAMIPISGVITIIYCIMNLYDRKKKG